MSILSHRLFRSFAVGGAIMAAVTTGPQSKAGELAGFRTPSGNIHCMFVEADAEFPANLRCDIMQVDTPLPRAPRDCDGEWGRSFSISTGDAIGQMICVGDAGSTKAIPCSTMARRGSRADSRARQNRTASHASMPSVTAFRCPEARVRFSEGTYQARQPATRKPPR